MKRIIYLLILVCIQTNSQNFKKAIKTLKSYDLENLDFSNLNELEKKYIKSQKNLILYSQVDTILNNKTNNNTSVIFQSLVKGDYYLFQKFPNDSLSLHNYKKALELSTKINDTTLIAESYKKILKLLFQNRTAINLRSSYIKNYKNFTYDTIEKLNYKFYKFTNRSAIENKDYIDSLKYYLPLVRLSGDIFLKAKYNQMIGVFYSFYYKNIDSAYFYMNKAKQHILSKPYNYFNNEMFGIYGNLGQYEEKRNNFELAKQYYIKANTIKVPKYRYLVKVKLNQILADFFKKRNISDSAYYYLKKANLYKDTLNEYNTARALIDIEIKYQTKKKEKENIRLKAQKIQDRNLLLGSILFIIFGGAIATLSLQNSNRKRKLAEQQKELETQKNLTLLKEQEITTINAMVDGQEKERKRIAEDLHDNLGSVLATLKLHFENLKINREKKKINQEDLFNKTENLIDEAYLKVRRIAHAKNAGVIANQGLLLAVQMMAEKISSADKIKIEVVHYGLDKRLENNVELTVFRIIQELVTNIIKHADAKNATINLSLYEKNLNIIIEDDGKGFDINKIDLNNGMGISSIKTRVEHLEGNFDIDTTLGKGSSIILNIPIS